MEREMTRKKHMSFIMNVDHGECPITHTVCVFTFKFIFSLNDHRVYDD